MDWIVSNQWFFAVIGALAVVGILGLALRKSAGPLGTALVAVAAIGIVAAVGARSIKTLVPGLGQKVPDRLHGVVGYMMGHHVLADSRGERGKVLLLFPPDRAVSKNALDTQYDFFSRVLAPQPALEVADFTLQVEPAAVNAGRISADEFEQGLAAAPDAVAYVSFAGVPAEPEKLSIFAGQTKRPLYVYDPAPSRSWVSALRQGLIRRVIVPRPDVDLPSGEQVAGPPGEIFAKYFLSGSPETVDKLLSDLGAARPE